MAMGNLLFQVDVSYNNFIGVPSLALETLSNLKMLKLQGNNFPRLNSKMYLSWSNTMRSLNLAENPWGAPVTIEIASFQILQNLNLSFQDFTGSIPSQIGELIQLEVLDL